MRFRTFLLLISLALVLLLPYSLGQIAPSVALRYDLQGNLDGVPYRILVPASWNGTLLVYQHGYAESATPPWLAPQISTQAAQDAEVNSLLQKGFALAASRFAGSGFQVKEGMQNTIALTSAFRGMVGMPSRTIIWGKSMGGLMTLGTIEKFPSHFDGAVALCPPAAGAPMRFDQALDIALAYSVVFGWNPDWGTVGDLRDNLDFVADILPDLQHWLTPAYKAQWEFIRMVNSMPADSFYQPYNARVVAVYFATAVRAELEARAGGPVAQNTAREYKLTDQQKADIKALNPAADPDSWLLQMNEAKKIAAATNARLYVEHYVVPSGVIKRPVLTMHTEGDPIAIPNHEAVYLKTVIDQGNGALLLQAFTTGPAHCSFTPAQEIAALDAMMSWLDSGQRPDPSVVFGPVPGFDLGYSIPDWPK